MAQDTGGTVGAAANEKELLGAFRRALGLGDEVTRGEIARGVLPEWDSMGHMEVVLEIESTFGIQIADSEVLTLDTFDRALELVSSGAPSGGG